MSETILITGAARRLGRHLALGLAADGHRIAIHYHRSHEDAARLLDDVEAIGGEAALFAADLADEAATAALVPKIAEQMGPPDLLINNASTFEKDSYLSSTRAQWDRHMDVNLRAPFLLSQQFARALPDQRNGLIIHMIDHRVWKPNPLFASYTLSKAALWALTRTMAQAFAPRIRVNAIGPGPVLPSLHQSEQDFAAEAGAVLLGKGPSLEEILDAVRFLMRTPSITGQMLALDGGQHLAWRTDDTGFGGGEDRDGRKRQ